MMKTEKMLEIMRDPELMKGIREGLWDIKAGRLYSKREIFGTAQRKNLKTKTP